jgi:hypothetical protein
MATVTSPRAFDVARFHAALDAARIERGLSWSGLAREMWDLSADLNAAHDHDHPISPSTVSNMGRRGDASCQHAVAFLRWLDRPPEDFIAEPRPGTAGVPLPETDPAHRLRWDLGALYAALDQVRTERGATWVRTAERLHCTPNQLTHLRRAKYATGMRLAMRICQGLGRPAADFVRPAAW